MTDTLAVLLEVFAERTRQDDKWGEQNWPIGGDVVFTVSANNSKANTEQDAQEGTLTWRHILHEEFWETFENEDSDPQSQRAELVQVAAVAVAMIECIDRKERLATQTIEFQLAGQAVRRFVNCKEVPPHTSGDGARSEESARGEEAPPQDSSQDVA